MTDRLISSEQLLEKLSKEYMEQVWNMEESGISTEEIEKSLSGFRAAMKIVAGEPDCVTRCRDCCNFCYCHDFKEAQGWCSSIKNYVGENDFCSSPNE